MNQLESKNALAKPIEAPRAVPMDAETIHLGGENEIRRMVEDLSGIGTDRRRNNADPISKGACETAQNSVDAETNLSGGKSGPMEESPTGSLRLNSKRTADLNLSARGDPAPAQNSFPVSVLTEPTITEASCGEALESTTEVGCLPLVQKCSDSRGRESLL